MNHTLFPAKRAAPPEKINDIGFRVVLIPFFGIVIPLITGMIDRKNIPTLLWGNDSFFNSRNLDVYIHKIRSYLKEDETLEILTIKGIGYRFVIE